MNSNVNWFFQKEKKWRPEIEKLREIILSCDLVEELKWGCPCYQFEKKNILLIHVFKEYCAVLFFKGSLLKDPKNILVQQTKNVQAARQIRFISIEQINKFAKTLKSYVYDAVKIEVSGLKVSLKKTSEFSIPEEFQNKMNDIPSLKKSFYELTPGRQRGYLLYFSSAKQSKTRKVRIEKYIPLILNGKGLDD
ncbi:MAG TPA: hypothetical protein DCQ93_01345 [Bacteroidetes bacterium]|nr:hypothetical protein [Bacteroidota bacterium]